MSSALFEEDGYCALFDYIVLRLGTVADSIKTSNMSSLYGGPLCSPSVLLNHTKKEVDPVVYNMFHEDPGNVSYSVVGGLSDQIRELRESIELPLINPELLH
ncbi:hypothetical protein LOK49_LG04G03760 [Camellia lanceoleosa]|uniref:Uncharacterized protein n=1 Tax=Camellia lanceoleosa TaxID=1840588 RepID=A0ACC0HVB4_9ERIC|nr:hypothetical protein LOK49_LG04G03760 [Camellia lanceoleosa]